MAQNQPDQFGMLCPLCDHEVHVTRRTGDMCQFCGASLDVFTELAAANQFAEECKERNEQVTWRPLHNGHAWVVAHKESPHQEEYRRAG